jgi:hypothetical protein
MSKMMIKHKNLIIPNSHDVIQLTLSIFVVAPSQQINESNSMKPMMTRVYEKNMII